MTKKTPATAKPSKFGKLLEQLLTVAAEHAATIKLDESGNPIVTDADRAKIAEAGSDIVHRIVVGKAKQLLEEFESEDEMTDDIDDLDDEIEGEELSDDIDAGDDDVDPDFEGEELGPDAVAELRDKLMSGEEDADMDDDMSDEDLDADADDFSDEDASDESDEDLDTDDFSDLSDDEDDGDFSAPDEDAVDDFKSKEGAFKA